MMKVWLIESGEYEQRGVCRVCASLDTALACIATHIPTAKPSQRLPPENRYGPYITIRQDDPRWDNERHTDVGDDYTVTPWDVET
jgi:hypothetical protein